VLIVACISNKRVSRKTKELKVVYNSILKHELAIDLYLRLLF